MNTEMGVGIITHVDVDGICSAAIAKIAYPEADVEFEEPMTLGKRLRALPPDWGTVIILDLGIDVVQKEEIKNIFRELSKSRKIIYIDHHPLPPGINRRTLRCHAFVHATDVSTSELALKYFKPPDSLEYIALLGAIGDYQQHTPTMRRLMARHYWRTAYLETFLLEGALEVSRGDTYFRRGLVKGLSQGLWPSDIRELLSRAYLGLSQEMMLKSYVKRNARKIARNIAVVNDVPFMATGKAASYLVQVTDAEIGIATFLDGNFVRLSARRAKDSDVNLRKLIGGAASKVGGLGGGHPAAAGGVVRVEKFKDFLKALKKGAARKATLERSEGERPSRPHGNPRLGRGDAPASLGARIVPTLRQRWAETPDYRSIENPPRQA
ncbi:MAG: DHHA1 domain-containing protein [Candidatus Hadarchaeales archaeon]